MPRRHWFERVLWVTIVALATWGALNVSLGQLQRFNDNPTVVTLEKDFRSWRFSLPAVTVCHGNRSDPENLVKAIKARWRVSPEDPRYSYYTRFVLTVANSDLFHLQGYEEFRGDASLNVDLLELVKEVMPELVIKTSSSQPLPLQWTPVMTESGACYITNSVAFADVALSKLRGNITNDLPVTCHYSAMVCYIIFEVTKTVHFYIHSPYDVAKTTEKASTVFPALNRFVELSVGETRAGSRVRDLSPRRRACRYTDEALLGKQVYSTEMCRLSCRSNLALELCGCRPFYYFFEVGPSCTPSGMWCLSQHSRELANFGGIRCNCSAPCLHAEFKENFVEDQLWGKGPFQERGAIRLSVQAPRSRYIREIVFHFEDLVVSFGGAAGLFLGASFITFIEIIYFMLEKVFGMFSTDEKPKPLKEQGSYERPSKDNIIIESQRFYY
ncbi:unnamed protein product [Leptosia nina]|uniref:Uncharacterized protein n=1 Tax=Leptosia nina TaxID=320188 RepID=A0AAV1K347_9NEOP